MKKDESFKQQKERDEQLLKPAVRIQELKNKLIILGHELKVKKQINDSLYRKTHDDDRNILYNIYVKFQGWYIINGETDATNYQLFKSDTGTDIHTLWFIRKK